MTKKKILFLGIYPRVKEISIHSEIYTRIFPAALFVITQTGNNPEVYQWLNG